MAYAYAPLLFKYNVEPGDPRNIALILKSAFFRLVFIHIHHSSILPIDCKRDYSVLSTWYNNNIIKTKNIEN
jgi:hypothetical protein